MHELDRCLLEYEGEFKAQEQASLVPSPLHGKMYLGIEQAMMARFLNADLANYYGGTAADQIIFQLRSQLFRRRHLPGNQRLERWVQPDAGVGLAATLLGISCTTRDGQHWPSGLPPISGSADLVNRPLPDFHTAGLMPLVLKWHKEMKQLLGPAFSVGFPIWCRGPLGNAFYLAGAEKTLMSMYEDQDFFHRLMRFGMDIMKKWNMDRRAYLNEPRPLSENLWNDEVAAENFPPRIYEELVAPYDREYVEFFGGKVGFHSCGNTTPLMKSIAAQGPWAYFHVSAWSNLDQALRLFPDTRLLICLHPYRDVLGCELSHTRKLVEEIAGKCKGRDYDLYISELMPVNSPAEDLQRIKDVWALCEDLLEASTMNFAAAE